jgi:hypothetical protein
MIGFFFSDNVSGEVSFAIMAEVFCYDVSNEFSGEVSDEVCVFHACFFGYNHGWFCFEPNIFSLHWCIMEVKVRFLWDSSENKFCYN